MFGKKSSSDLSPEKLKFFQPFQHLSEEQLIMLSQKAEIKAVHKGKDLCKIGSTDDEEFFLLEGEVDLINENGDSRKISGGSDNAKDPLARLRPRRYHVCTLTDVKYLSLKSNMLNGLLKQAPNESYHVDDKLRENESDSHQIFFDIYSDLRNNKLVLPSLPEVALNIKKMIDSGKSNVKAISNVINKDPAITAKILRAANSPLYRGQRPFNTCSDAVVRLGLGTTKQLVMSFSTKELFKVDHPILRSTMDGIWQHSMDIAAICYVLAQKIKGLHPEEAMLSGLLHNIGAVPILQYAPKYEDLIKSPDLLESCIGEIKSELGGVILQRWGFDKQIVNAAKYGDSWGRTHDGIADYADLVIISQLHNLMGTEKGKHAPRITDVPAFEKLKPSGLSPELSLEVLEEAKVQIAEARKLLSS